MSLQLKRKCHKWVGNFDLFVVEHQVCGGCSDGEGGGREEVGGGLWALWGSRFVLGGWASAALWAASQLRTAGPFQGDF